MPNADPSAEHRRLAIFVGSWRTEGEVVAGASGAGARLQATDDYEWLPGEYFLLHRVDGRLGSLEVQVHEIIGYDSERKTYFSHSFDNHGRVSTYDASLVDRAWSITGETERFSGSFSDDGRSLTGTWEQKSDTGQWARWMTIRLMKVA